MSEERGVQRPRVRRASREQLLHMLAEAAEFEHNLLCCYLYAAFSLKQEADGELSAAALSKVTAWRKSIMAVAMEEMGHLALVANLTVSIGGRAHFNRPNLPVSPGYHPADIVVELAPFTMETLDHFIYLERPSDVTIPDGDGFTPEAQYDRGDRAGVALMPSAYDYETIAEFYDSIRAAFSSLHEEPATRVFSPVRPHSRSARTWSRSKDLRRSPISRRPSQPWTPSSSRVKVLPPNRTIRTSPGSAGSRRNTKRC